MENKRKLNLFWLIAIMAIPFIYLALIWNTIPDTIATHFNINGEADDFGSKNALIWLSIILMVPIFLILELIPIIDPKQKIQSMGDSFDKLKFIIIGLMSALSLFIIHASSSGEIAEIKIISAIIGVFYMVLGNYLPTIKPNYFMGIRTPWTLENEVVWRKTHRIAGRIFMIGGFFVAFLSLLSSNQIAFILLMTFSIGSTLFLLAYSYTSFKKAQGEK